MASNGVQLQTYVRNIACSKYDEERNPLSGRLETLIEDIKASAAHVVVLLEAGRSSGDWSWTKMADFIETATGLTYEGVMYATSTPNSFGHAVFARRTHAHVVGISNAMSFRTTSPGGVQATIVTVKPVMLGSHPHDCMSLGVIHMPMGIEGRRAGVEWLIANKERASVWVGDFNTFSDDIGPWMVQRLKEAGLRDLPCTQPITFSAFEGDTLTVPLEKRDLLHPMCEVLSETDTHVTVRPVSVLDHVFVQENVLVSFTAEFLPLTRASDHCGILVIAIF